MFSGIKVMKLSNLSPHWLLPKQWQQAELSCFPSFPSSDSISRNHCLESQVWSWLRSGQNHLEDSQHLRNQRLPQTWYPTFPLGSFSTEVVLPAQGIWKCLGQVGGASYQWSTWHRPLLALGKLGPGADTPWDNREPGTPKYQWITHWETLRPPFQVLLCIFSSFLCHIQLSSHLD